MKQKLDEIKDSIVSGFTVISMIGAGIQPAIHMVKNAGSVVLKETGIAQPAQPHSQSKKEHQKT